MTIINIEGLGKVEIEGETPNAQEQKAIIDALGNINKSESSVKIEKPSVEIENQYLDKIPESDVEKGLETETAIPELIDPNLAELGKPQGLEKIGGRPTFEAVGAIAGSIPGTLTGNLPVAVGGGTLGAMGTGQLYDLLQSAIVEEPTNLESQVGRAVDDFKREALLQSFFAKVPGLLTKTKGLVFGKSDKGLYDAAKRQGFPLSLSDSGNVISKGYGRVIGIFPYVGGPTKKAAIKKADFINKAADDTLNSFAPNVTLSKLGIDMTKASQSTFDDFRRISSFFYDDFFKAVDNISNTPVIPTQNYKKALLKYVKLVDGGKLKGITDPRKDSIYKYAKQTSRKLPEYINATQYRALKDAIKYYANSAQKNQPYDVKVLTGFKSSLETDLRLLTKEGYQENLLKNIYPLSKTGRQKLDPKLLADIANKLKFADKVYANGLQNSIIKEIAEKEGKKKVKGLVPVPGKKTFDAPVGSTFKRVDKNIFGAGFESPGSLNADEIGEALLRRNASPKFFSDLKSIVGQKQFDRFVRAKLQKAYDGSLVNIDKQIGGLAFDPYKFEKNLGLNTEKGREILEEMLKGSKVTLEKLDDFFLIAKNHAGLKVPDVSSFVARRAALGGTRSLLGGAVMTAGITTNPVIGIPLIYMARKTSGFLSNPKQLDDVMRVLDPNSTAAQVKTTSLKLLDALISDSQNQIEENELRLYKEFIETTPLEDIKKGIEDTLNSSEQFLNLKEEDNEEIPIIENMSMTQNIPKTPNINPNLVVTAPKVNQQLSETEKALLSPSEQVIASRT
tara:strand:+ start:1199 stop:3568 length:2370 start_codon:yes stop_codon:yes gene_type:complete